MGKYSSKLHLEAGNITLALESLFDVHRQCLLPMKPAAKACT